MPLIFFFPFASTLYTQAPRAGFYGNEGTGVEGCRSLPLESGGEGGGEVVVENDHLPGAFSEK